MTNIRRVPRAGAQILFASVFALLLAGCVTVTCVDCKKECGENPNDPVNCSLYATDVQFDGDGDPLCKKNIGVSKKCSVTNKRCPLAAGPSTCKTKVMDSNGNCACTCP